MSNEKHDPWALLREAREVVAAVAESGNQDDILRDRIDAALAEHDAVPPSEVEWKDRRGEYIHDDGANRLRVYLWADIWHWHTTVEYRADGYKHMLDEAKSAAIAAARGMR